MRPGKHALEAQQTMDLKLDLEYDGKDVANPQGLRIAAPRKSSSLSQRQSIEDPLNAFIVPPAWDVTTDYLDNLIVVNGSTITIKWSNNSTSFDVFVNSYSIANGDVGSLGLLSSDKIDESLKWTVSTAGMPIGDMYYMSLADLDGSEFGSTTFDSHFFNISASAASTSARVHSTSPTAQSTSPIVQSTSPSVPSTSARVPSASVAPSAKISQPLSSTITTSSRIQSSSTAPDSHLPISSKGAATTSVLPSKDSASSSLDAGTKAGIALGVILGIIILALGCGTFCYLRKHRRNTLSETTIPYKQPETQSTASENHRSPIELEGAYSDLTPPVEMIGNTRHLHELYGGPRSPRELNGDLREPAELSGSF